ERRSEMVLAQRMAAPPLWLEAWVREYFVVDDDDMVFFPWTKAWRRRVNPDPEAPPPPELWEDEAKLMDIEEEIRLRYGRAHRTMLSNAFRGARGSWLRRFFDVTSYGDVIPKSAARQTQEAIAIASRIVDTTDGYTADEAFEDFGCAKTWLRLYFTLDEETGCLGFDEEASMRAWEPPAEDKAPSPWTYAKLDAPRGYIRKGNGKYLPRKYGHKAGGILY
ncbi:unnamed protein product, partial [Polarella glacialis]